MRTDTRHAALRAGFSLVEVLVALTVTGIGLVALAGTTAVLLAHGTSAAAALSATARLTAVVDSLRVAPCLSLGTGRNTANGVTITWAVSGTGPVRRVVATAAWGVARRHTLTSESMVLCD